MRDGFSGFSGPEAQPASSTSGKIQAAKQRRLIDFQVRTCALNFTKFVQICRPARWLFSG